MLFTSTAAPTARRISLDGLGIVAVDDGVVPAYEAVRRLFPVDVPPPLPGIVFVERFTNESEPVYAAISIDDGGAAHSIRGLLYHAATAYVQARQSPTATFVTELATAFAGAGVEYRRLHRRTMREWLAAAFRLANDHAGALVSVVKLF